jgi:hypothetical protein
VHVPGVLATELTGRLRAELDAAARARARPSSYGLICHQVWPHVALAGAVLAEILAPLALAVLELDEIVLFQDHVIAKLAGTAAEVRWHQDFSYWPLDAPRGVTMWVALDGADRQNGCLRYIPGTHRLGELHPADFFAGAVQPRRDHLPALDAAARAGEAVDAPARPGDVLVHDPLVWHMSPGNLSSRPRHAWSLTWIAPSLRWDPKHAPHPFNFTRSLVAGAPVAGPGFPRYRR